MKKVNTYRVVVTSTSLLFFIIVIILTNDYFDDLKQKNTILVTLLIIQFGIIVFGSKFYPQKQLYHTDLRDDSRIRKNY